MRTPPARTTTQQLLEQWQRAALLKDRTRRAIRERHRAGETTEALAADYDIPDAFVRLLCAWQLFPDADDAQLVQRVMRSTKAVTRATRTLDAIGRTGGKATVEVKR